MQEYARAMALWQSLDIKTEKDLDRHLHNFRVLFAYNSGKIENTDITYHDTREIFEDGRVTGFSGNPRTLFEQQNQKLCYEVLKGKILRREPLGIELIKDMHRILTAGTYDEQRYIHNEERPGEFKRHDYVTGILEVGSPSENVEQELSELIDEMNRLGSSDPLKAGAYLHARFEYIHPFADGNGRVGRTLLNYWLMINNHPPLIIYDEDKSAYYAALQTYDAAEDLQPLLHFLRQSTAKTWRKTCGLAEGKHVERKGLKDLL